MMRPGNLNYQHLRYFRTVANEGTVLQASRVLHLTPSTVSSQLKVLEEDLGAPLFQRVGRNLVLTPFGTSVLRYADAIFELGDELTRMVTEEQRRVVRVGVSSVLPKLLTRELLRPAIRDDVQLILREGSAAHLESELSSRQLEVVLSDAQLPTFMMSRNVSHLLVETGIAVFGARHFVKKVGDDLPGGLARVPWLVPPTGTSLRQGLEHWWRKHDLIPDIAAIIDDSALLKGLADAGAGVFAAPARMRAAILEGYNVECIGETDEVKERVYAITADEDPKDAVIRAICGLPPSPIR